MNLPNFTKQNKKYNIYSGKVMLSDIDKKYQNLKWELPTLSLLYKSQYDISHCYYKVYNLMNIRFHLVLPFLLGLSTKPNHTANKKSPANARLFDKPKKGCDVEPNKNIKSEELLRRRNHTLCKIKKSLI